MVTPCTTKILAGREYRCFFELTLQLIGGKWKPIIIYHLAIEGVMRFGELKRSIGGITERMLTRQLRELEKDSLVHRKVFRQVPPKVEYSLKPLGARLIPILQSMREWGVDYERHFHGNNQLPANDEEKLEPPAIAPVYQQYSLFLNYFKLKAAFNKTIPDNCLLGYEKKVADAWRDGKTLKK